MIKYIQRRVRSQMHTQKMKKIRALELKILILANLKAISPAQQVYDVFAGKQKSFGKDMIAAEDHGRASHAQIVPFYRGVCVSLMRDKCLMSKLPQGARLEVNQYIARDHNAHYHSQLVITLNCAQTLAQDRF